MKRVCSLLLLAAGFLAPTIASAQSISCVRGGLQRAVDLYVAAQTTGDLSGLPLANGLGYVENMERVEIRRSAAAGQTRGNKSERASRRTPVVVHAFPEAVP
jgi:hypothetical protein